VAKLGKATQDDYNWGEWLIWYALLENWVAEGVEVNDSIAYDHIFEVDFLDF
jgi:hypothetical protein